MSKARLLAVASAATLVALGAAGPAAAGGGYDRGHDRSHGADDDRKRDDRKHEARKDHEPPADYSIQAAVDAAGPGDTIHVPPGTYRESVTIREDGISLRSHGVVLEPAGAEATACDALDGPETDRVSGICILGEIDLQTFTAGDRVSGVSIRGITVSGATGDGLVAVATEDLSVRDSRFTDNGGYGAASFVTEGTSFRGNKATGNAEAGFYIGDSEKADADVRGNYSADNEIGYFYRNASAGKMRGNVATGNCVGVLLLAGAPGPVTGWEVRKNEVSANNTVCAGNPEDGIPPLSGAGMVLAGAQDVRVRDNVVRDNHSAAESVVEGGVVVISTDSLAEAELVPGFAPSGEVERNEAKGNEPADINWDGTGTVEFGDNRCRTSIPGGLCG
ncbi:right-handed parallel beta-helix repeat-containing protein [Blastococcus sp. SYSU DS0973]